MAFFLEFFSGFLYLLALLLFEGEHDVEFFVSELLEVLIPGSFEVEHFLAVGFFY